MMKTVCFLLVFVGFCVAASDSGNLATHPLIWNNAQESSEIFRDLSAADQSGDSTFFFGGQDVAGYADILYAWGSDTDGIQRFHVLKNNSHNSKGHFGAQKTLSHTFYPSSRSGACMNFMTSSHAFIFGGRGIDSTGQEGFLNDLWISEDFAQWGWFSGSDRINQPSIYVGKESVPGARWRHTCGAHFESKKFIVFGGTGQHPANDTETAILDDLFEYGESGWKLLAGGAHSQPPDFNISSGLQNPGGRAEHASVLFENGFYVFGGNALERKNTGEVDEVMMADLWVWDLLSKKWLYIGGSHIPNIYGVYPSAIGLGGSVFGPGARVQAAMTYNDLTNDIYLFGGFGFDYNGELGLLNDLWCFVLKDKSWIWLGGSSSHSAKGSLELPYPAPSARSASILFAGSDGLENDLTLFGGVGMSGKEHTALTDVWRINMNAPQNFTIAVPHSTTTTTTKQHIVQTTTTTKHESVTEEPVVVSTHHESATTHHQETTEEIEEHTTKKPLETTAKHTTTEDVEEATTTTKKPVVTTSKLHIVATTHTTLHFTSDKDKQKTTDAPTHGSLFEAENPQKVAALVMGSFIAVIILVGGIIFLGFSFVQNAAQQSPGARSVMEPYNAV